MIQTELKKLHLIESLLKENNEAVLIAIEKLLKGSSVNSGSKFKDFSTVLTMEELNAFEKNIQDGCEQINEDDWK